MIFGGLELEMGMGLRMGLRLMALPWSWELLVGLIDCFSTSSKLRKLLARID